ATLGAYLHLHETYFIIAHMHYTLVGAGIMGYLAAVHYWWPKITGRMYPEKLGQLAALVSFIGFNLTFFPQFVVGYLGMPRRYHAYSPEFQIYNVLSTAGASVLGVAYLLPLIYLIWSLKYGKRAPQNPWNATGLEWQTTSPPDKHNFKETPIVTGPPYQYSPQAEEEMVHG
ncbi:MAG: cbb3-type cytochrome c oxidase subunit I, partial [Limisphaerales bacterium]